MDGAGVDWIQLVQDGDTWQALVITVVNLRVSYSAGTFFGYLGSTPCS